MRQCRAVLHARQRVLGQSDRGQSGPVRTFVMGGPGQRNHTALARKLQDCLAGATPAPATPDVLAAQRRERARVRSERQHCWGRPKTKAA
jgi:hypothetical protein